MPPQDVGPFGLEMVDQKSWGLVYPVERGQDGQADEDGEDGHETYAPCATVQTGREAEEPAAEEAHAALIDLIASRWSQMDQ